MRSVEPLYPPKKDECFMEGRAERNSASDRNSGEGRLSLRFPTSGFSLTDSLIHWSLVASHMLQPDSADLNAFSFNCTQSCFACLAPSSSGRFSPGPTDASV